MSDVQGIRVPEGSANHIALEKKKTILYRNVHGMIEAVRDTHMMSRILGSNGVTEKLADLEKQLKELLEQINHGDIV